MAPEVGRSEGFAPGEGYGRPSDMWSVGVLAFVLLSGEYPYTHDDVNEEVPVVDVDALLEGPEASSAWSTVSSEARQVLKMLLRQDPLQRATSEALLMTPWLSQGGDCLSKD